MEHSPNRFTELPNAIHFWERTYRVLLLSLWGFLFTFALLVFGAVMSTGLWPSYGQPDPKSLLVWGWLVAPLMVYAISMLLVLPASLFALGVLASRQQTPTWVILGWHFLAIVLIYALLFLDAGGLMTWLVD
jgi:hypothetical protein